MILLGKILLVFLVWTLTFLLVYSHKNAKSGFWMDVLLLLISVVGFLVLPIFILNATF